MATLILTLALTMITAATTEPSPHTHLCFSTPAVDPCHVRQPGDEVCLDASPDGDTTWTYRGEGERTARVWWETCEYVGEIDVNDQTGE